MTSMQNLKVVFNELVASEQETVDKHWVEIESFLSKGDESGNYDEAVATLGEFLLRLEEHVEQAAEYMEVAKDSENEKMATALKKFFRARYDYFWTLRSWLLDELSDEQLERAQRRFESALTQLNALSTEQSVAQ